ncbi:MAG: hypothetical protein H6623_09255 [Bdellovibrionaceae bacterium]|nr:hypothetical protein [Pseudobdellovibrionaceae bacterium]
MKLPDTINKDVTKALSEDELTYDKEQLLYALDHAYSGRRFLPKDEFLELRDRIHYISDPVTVQSLCHQIAYYFQEVSDNHLRARFNDRSCFVSRRRQLPNVGSNYYRKQGKIWDVRRQKKKNKMALLISILEFPNSQSQEWNGFMEAIQKQINGVDLVILDLRGNSGGDDTIGRELANFMAGGELKDPYLPQWSSYTPESLQLFINLFTLMEQKALAEGKEAPTYVHNLREKFTLEQDAVLDGQKAQEYTSQKDYGEEFSFAKSQRKPIYILVDAGCASSCESTVDFFENNPLAVTVGEQTAGYVHFGNNGRLVLKNSGIQIQMAISYNAYRDGRFIEKKGIAPKISVPSGHDAFDIAWGNYLRAGH